MPAAAGAGASTFASLSSASEGLGRKESTEAGHTPGPQAAPATGRHGPQPGAERAVSAGGAPWCAAAHRAGGREQVTHAEGPALSDPGRVPSFLGGDVHRFGL